MAKGLDINKVIAEVELLHVATLELSAARTNLTRSNDEMMASFEDEGHEVEMDFDVAFDLDDEHDRRFRVRLQTEIESEPGIIRVNLAAEYELEELNPRHIPDEVMLEFTNNVALMTLLPYVRQAIADISQRVFTYPLTMPLYKVGDVAFT